MSRHLENEQNINKDLERVLDKNRYYKIFVWSLILVFFVLFIFSLPTLLPKTSKLLFGGEQIFAVPYQSRVENNRIYKRIIWVKDIEEEFYENQLVVVYDDWTDSYWVEKIIEYNNLEEELIVTHNGTTLRIVDYEDVYGEFNRESNFFGNIYYFVSRSFGILIMGSAMFTSLAIYYFGFIRPVQKFNRKFKASYLDE